MLLLVGLTSIILLATLLLARWSFEQGFINFLQGQELERLSLISREITQSNPGIRSIDEINKLSLDRIIDRHSLLQGKPRRPKPSPRGEGEDRSKMGERPERGQRGERPPPPPQSRNIENKYLFTAVYDLNGNYIVGDAIDEELAKNLIIFELNIEQRGRVIGVLKSWKNERFESSIASEFSTQQLYTSLFIGMFCLTLAAVLSFFGAKTILAPIKLIIKGVEDLSNGNYTSAIENTRNDEIGDLINNVNRLADVLEQTRTAKNRWFADISHELRTPLTVLMGELEAIKLGVRPLSFDQIDSLKQEALLLKRLVDDLYQLSISDIGALRYEYANVDLSELVSRFCEHAVTQANEKSISFETAITKGITANIDANRINQLIGNLVTNSLAYTDDNGTTKVSLYRNDNQICLSIVDSAPSLSKAECEQIFDPLYRHEKSRTRNKGGAGLGLAITKNIVLAHGGTISAKPSTLGGIQILVSLPSPLNMTK